MKFDQCIFIHCIIVLCYVTFRSAQEQDGEAMPMGLGVDVLSTQNIDVEDEGEAETPIYEKYDALLHGNLRSKK